MLLRILRPGVKSCKRHRGQCGRGPSGNSGQDQSALGALGDGQNRPPPGGAYDIFERADALRDISTVPTTISPDRRGAGCAIQFTYVSVTPATINFPCFCTGEFPDGRHCRLISDTCSVVIVRAAAIPLALRAGGSGHASIVVRVARRQGARIERSGIQVNRTQLRQQSAILESLFPMSGRLGRNHEHTLDMFRQRYIAETK